jgi:RND family efflux transporter MFP subunit
MTEPIYRTPSPPTARRAKLLGVSLAVAFSALITVGASRYQRAEPPPAQPSRTMTVGEHDVTLTPDAPQYNALRLGAAKAASPRYREAVPARVTIDETRASRVGTPLSGRVTGVFVELGQAVKAGDPLFRVASPDIAGLRIERDKAAVDLDVAKTQLERVRTMVEARALPAKDELEANQTLRQAQLALRLAQSKFASLKVAAGGDNEFTVVAPRAGTIVEKTVLPSQEVSPEGSLMTLVDLGSVWVIADLFEADAMGIHDGTAVEITSPSMPGFKESTQVEMVSAVVDPVRHTIPVRVRLSNEAGKLRPNAYAQARFAVEPIPGSVEIPSTAIVSNGSRKYVYAQEAPGRFVRREVTAGSQRDSVVPIFAGLREGEVVVEEGAILLDNQIALSN